MVLPEEIEAFVELKLKSKEYKQILEIISNKSSITKKEKQRASKQLQNLNKLQQLGIKWVTKREKIKTKGFSAMGEDIEICIKANNEFLDGKIKHLTSGLYHKIPEINFGHSTIIELSGKENAGNIEYKFHTEFKDNWSSLLD